MKFKKVINEFRKELILNSNISYIDNTFQESNEESINLIKEQSEQLHSSFAEFYKEVSYYSMKWENTIKLKEDVAGSVKILQPEKAISDWKEVIYFDDDSPLKFFKVFDQFSDDACCGFYTPETKLEPHHVLYYYDYHNESFSLHLDVEGYIQMMIYAKGFLYWQKVVLDHLRDVNSGNTKLMKDNLHQVFDDFDFDEFIAKYEELKL